METVPKRVGAGENVGVLHHPAKAKNVIVLFMAGGPSQLELFSHKPKLTELHVKNSERVHRWKTIFVPW